MSLIYLPLSAYASVSQPCACAFTVNAHVSDAPSTPAGKRTKIDTSSSTALANQTCPKSSARYQKQSNIASSGNFLNWLICIIVQSKTWKGLWSHLPNVSMLLQQIHACKLLTRHMLPDHKILQCLPIPQPSLACHLQYIVLWLHRKREFRIQWMLDHSIFRPMGSGQEFIRIGERFPKQIEPKNIILMDGTRPELADDNTRVKKPIWKRIDGKAMALAMYEQAYNEGRCRTLPPLF